MSNKRYNEKDIVNLYNKLNNVSEVARKLNMHKSTVHYILKRNHISVDKKQNNNDYDLLKLQIEKQQDLINQLMSKNVKFKTEPDALTYTRKCDDSSNERVLLISDLHAPYHHQDAYDFLEALSLKYKFDRIINLGDEMDYHFASFHTVEPEALGGQQELEEGRELMRKLEALFPEVDLVDSNHGSMAYRKAKEAGLPKHLIMPYRDAIFGELTAWGEVHRPGNRGHGWRWHPNLTIQLPQVGDLYIAHQIAADARNAVRRIHGNIAQGHFHTEFAIRYEESPTKGLLFGISGGCLIDDRKVAFNYNKLTPARPVIGCAAIIDGCPKLFPMLRNSDNRWIGVIP